MILNDKSSTNKLTVPTISVIMPTYNHRSFIAEAIESVLMQEVGFNVEILLHDDCSKDGTTDIVRSYAERYSNIIRPFFQRENQFSQGRNPIRLLLSTARGKYITLLEGDDAWTDPLKLSKQVEFLDNNPQFIICYGNARIIDSSGIILDSHKVPPENCRHRSQKEIIGINAVMPTATVMFRNHPILKNLPGNAAKILNGDVFLFAILAQYGSAGYVDISPSHYRQHPGGVYSSLDDEQKVIRGMSTVLELHACIAPEYRPWVAETIVRRYQRQVHFFRTSAQRWKLVQTYILLLLFSVKNRPLKKLFKDFESASRVVAKSFLRDRHPFF